jgi:DNA-binding response OmpR family regulator
MVVLFIDDDPDDFEIFCDALKKFDPAAKCLHSIDGEEAIGLLNGLTPLPDYIFLDINMPRMGGKECLSEIKKDSKLKDIQVFMFSTTTYLSEINTYIALGARDFIIKPTSVNELVDVFKAVLKYEPQGSPGD